MTVFHKVPLLKALKAISLRKNPGTYCFYLLLGIVTLLLIAKVCIPGVRHQFLRQFHLSSPTFLQWGGLQFIPSMYSFGNEFWYSNQPIPERELTSEPSAPIIHGWLNHYPSRVVTFTNNRQFLNIAGPADFVAVRSRYRGEALTTYYAVRKQGEAFQMEFLKENFAR